MTVASGEIKFQKKHNLIQNRAWRNVAKLTNSVTGVKVFLVNLACQDMLLYVQQHQYPGQPQATELEI